VYFITIFAMLTNLFQNFFFWNEKSVQKYYECVRTSFFLTHVFWGERTTSSLVNGQQQQQHRQQQHQQQHRHRHRNGRFYRLKNRMEKLMLFKKGILNVERPLMTLYTLYCENTQLFFLDLILYKLS
jgi:hypothetical protein